MPQQILTPSGASIWNHRDCQFVGDIQHGDKSTVLWRDTNWFLKFNDHSVNEVIGYRLADFLGLPVQPWLAVEMDKIEDTGVDVPHVAILIQKWANLRLLTPLQSPVAKHPTIIGKALALASLITDDVEWMSDAAMNEIRLIDLELCGPGITFMKPPRWCDLVDGYIDCVRWNVCRCYGLAFEVPAIFFEGISTLAKADLLEVLDFTGYSRAPDVTDAAVSFLQPAQRMISHILG